MFDSSVNHEENNGGISYKTLIPVRMGELGGEAVQLCNARDLHICLGAGSRFNDLIARRIGEYGFIEGQDFYSELSKKAAGRKGRASMEYSISVDMAKELAMVERTEAGRRIRRYFIACERALHKIAPEVAAECLRKALNHEQQFALKQKVDNKVACLDKARQRAGYHEIWSNLKSRHQVAQYRDIPQAEFEDACNYVDAYAWSGEWIGKQHAVTLNEHDLLNLNALITHAIWIRQIYRQYGMHESLKRLGSRAGVELHDHVTGAYCVANVLGNKFKEGIGRAKGDAEAFCLQADRRVAA